jgi:cytochrome c-type biogenesis protein CcmH
MHWQFGTAAAAATLVALALGWLWAAGPEPDLPADVTTATAPANRAYAALQKQTQRRPKDARAWVLKARMDVEAGRHELAASAYAQALAVDRKVARDAGVWVEYAEAQGLAQNGRLAGAPMRHVLHALELNPQHLQALDLAGSAAWEAKDFAAAQRYWRQLQGQLPAGDARHAPLSRALAQAEQLARLSLPTQR